MPSISAGIGFNRVVKPKFGMPVDEEAVTLADLFAYGHFEFLAGTPEGGDLLAGSPLLGWMERMAERPSVRNTTWERLAETAAA
jgi:glutathione S-transferase